MKSKRLDNFLVDYAVSREQMNAQGEKMYIQTRMAKYADKLWELLKKDNTYIYMCGLKGMEKGIDDIMGSLAARDGEFYAFNQPHIMLLLDHVKSFQYSITLRDSMFLYLVIVQGSIG